MPATRLDKEKAQFGFIRNRKKPGTWAFVARANTGRGADRSVVLVGSEVAGWIQAVKCWHGNHAERASEYVAAYNAAQPKNSK